MGKAPGSVTHPIGAIVRNVEFARALGITHGHASRIRTGRRLPSPALLVRMSDTWQLPLDQLTRACAEGPMAFASYLAEQGLLQ